MDTIKCKETRNDAEWYENELKELFAMCNASTEEKKEYLEDGLYYDFIDSDLEDLEHTVEEQFDEMVRERFLDAVVIKTRFSWGVDLCYCFGGPNCYMQITNQVDFGFYWGTEVVENRWWGVDRDNAINFAEQYFSWVWEEFENLENGRH